MRVDEALNHILRGNRIMGNKLTKCPGCGNHIDRCCCGEGENPFPDLSPLDEPIDPDQHKRENEGGR